MTTVLSRERETEAVKWKRHVSMVDLIFSFNNLLQNFLATSPISALVSALMRFASHSHRWSGQDFSLTPMPRQGIKLMRSPLDLFEGTLIQDALLTKLLWPEMLCTKDSL